MSTKYENKIIFEEGGSEPMSHPFIDMEGLEQVSYNLENDAVRNYLNNVTYAKTDVITTDNKISSTKTKVKPYFNVKAYRYPFGSSISAWSESTRPVVLSDTKVGDIITFTSLDHTMSVTGTAGATLIYNLIPRRFYSYTISRSGNTVKTGYFNTEGRCRMIRIQIPNFRDLGGYKCDGGTISYNKIFRGCGMAGTDAGKYSSLKDPTNNNADIPNKEAVINSLVNLGITNELDLRNPNDSTTRQRAVNPGYPAGTLSYKNIQGAAYSINSNTVLALKHISDVLSNGGKLWFHCHTGADRAGTLTAVVMILLGCDIDSIIKEYELSLFNGNGYDVTYIDGTEVEFRDFLYDLYILNTSKSLAENTVTKLKNVKPSSLSKTDIDNIIQNLKDRLVTKTVAVIGDSYSAYTGSGPKVEIEGYTKDEVYAGEYPSNLALPINLIWWARVAQHFGWNVANYSWSGCTVTPVENVPVSERVCSSDARIDRLSYLLGGTAPDIIFCMIGYNDANAIEKGKYGITLDKLESAYRTMLSKITAKYPNARIYCLTNVQRSSSGAKYTSYKNFNTRLATIVNSYPAATLIDISNVFGKTATGNTIGDGTHPNAEGFRKIAEGIIGVLGNSYPANETDEDTVVESYDFIYTHLQPSGFSSGNYQGIVMQDSTWHQWDFAEFPVNAGDVVQVGVNGVRNLDTNDGTKMVTFFAEYPGGAIKDALALGYNEYKKGWYDGCYEFHWGSIPLKTKTVDGRTHYYAEYTVKHTGKLTVGLKVNDYTTDSLGGAFVKINGELKS